MRWARTRRNPIPLISHKLSGNFEKKTSFYFDLSQWSNERSNEMKGKNGYKIIARYEDFKKWFLPEKIYEASLPSSRAGSNFSQRGNPMIEWREINFSHLHEIISLVFKNEKVNHTRKKERINSFRIFFITIFIYNLFSHVSRYESFFPSPTISLQRNPLNSSPLNYYVNFDKFSSPKVCKVFFVTLP